MDKFILKRKRDVEDNICKDDNVEAHKSCSVSVFVPTCGAGANSADVSSTQPTTPKIRKTVKVDNKVKCRYYDKSYIKYGFISNMCDPPLPLCVICNQTLSNNSMKPSLLQRHLITNHGEFKDKPVDFFERKVASVSKTLHVIHNFTQSSTVALETSYKLALLTAKNKASYAAVESLIIPGALIIANKMLDIKSANKIIMIPHSDTTVSR